MNGERFASRRAATHQAGHLVLLLELGDPAPRGRIFEDPLRGAWGGECDPSISYPTARWRRLAGLGWICATTLDYSINADVTFDVLCGGDLRLSKADAALAGNYNRADVCDAFDILLARWDEIQYIACLLADTTCLESAPPGVENSRFRNAEESLFPLQT